MAIDHNGYTFRCDMGGCASDPLTVESQTERTAIAHAREEQWDVLRVRVVSGVPKGKVARTIRFVCCPGHSWNLGVRWP